MAKANHGFSPDKVAEFREAFDLWNTDGNAVLDYKEMTQALKGLGDFDEKALEKIMREVDDNKDGVIDFNEFMNALWRLQTRGDASAFGTMVKKQMELIAIETASGGMHSYAKEEISAFASHLNYCLGDDPQLAYLMPIDPDTNDIFEKVKDGLLITKFINMIEPHTIDMRAVNYKKGGGLNQFKVIENQNLNIAAAKAVGLSFLSLCHCPSLSVPLSLSLSSPLSLYPSVLVSLALNLCLSLSCLVSSSLSFLSVFTLDRTLISLSRVSPSLIPLWLWLCVWSEWQACASTM